ncbi:MAG: KTSC domain-containing protein [Chryseobacterium sp.]|nr:MAG: KTSC domain-containing protein [Chryseobacterium sp.]
MPSSVIAKIEYDELNELLRIEFQSGKIYYYMGVPRGVYLTLKTTRSKGGYFNKYIKGNYEFEEIDLQ